MILAGIDFGAKLAGTTAIAVWDDTTLYLLQSKKQKDADEFIQQQIQHYQVNLIGLDAPLSLPGVYQQFDGFQDYFYRLGDKSLRAMSPMFLGGLTARAMQLTHQLRQDGKTVIEVYPAALAKEIALQHLAYKQDLTHIPRNIEALKQQFPWLPTPIKLDNWHQFDALLALCSTWRYTHQKGISYGNEQEGMIYV
jgi:predicted nuclease with RNAse H fold